MESEQQLTVELRAPRIAVVGRHVVQVDEAVIERFGEPLKCNCHNWDRPTCVHRDVLRPYLLHRGVPLVRPRVGDSLP